MYIITIALGGMREANLHKKHSGFLLDKTISALGCPGRAAKERLFLPLSSNLCRYFKDGNRWGMA